VDPKNVTEPAVFVAVIAASKYFPMWVELGTNVADVARLIEVQPAGKLVAFCICCVQEYH
jgi:hypothetical protein